jgi:serine/threonine protein kinase/Tfp pilus assembly protein PilF
VKTTDDSGPLLPSDWDHLAPLVDQLLDAPRDQRPNLLDRLAAGDPARRAALERLVAECERELPLLDRPAVERFDQLAGNEPAPPLPDVLGGRYRIEREVGCGGMARVYLAQDLKHARQVAIKVIRPELAASLGRDRFLREIGIAARLRHPNIMPLYDSGDADGVLYFVMPYEEGLSLRARIERDGPLPMTDAVSVLRDVARALAYAHEHGVVHRDVKPDNVMLSGDAAVVTDFGIAKAFSAALTEGGGGTITQVGSVIGTPAYMAPEQATGDPAIDHRADIYSFGCLAYEAVTGKPPFAGASTHQIIAGHLGTAARPVTESRKDVPATVAGLIARCLEKDPAARPQNASELLNVLGSLSTLDQAPIHWRRVPRFLGPVLLFATLGIAVAGYFILRGRTTDTGPVTVAVLPLGSQGGDSLQALLADGFSDDIATALVKHSWVRVMSRKGSGNYRGQREINPQETGKELGARYLVMGSFRNIGGRLTVLVQLVSSEDASVLWADQFDRPPELAALRDQIATTIGDSLYSKAGPGSRARVVATAPAHRRSNEAYYRFLLGKEKLSRRGQSVAASIVLFREAIALDSLSAEAYAGLSLALALAPYFQGAVSVASISEEATAAARRAAQLDPNLAGPHTALGMLLEENFQWDSAGSEFKTALQLDRHDAEAGLQYGRYLAVRGRTAEAIRQLQAALEDDPASAALSSNLAGVWLMQGELDSALAESKRALRIDSVSLPAVLLGAQVLVATGQTRKARQLIEHNPPYDPNTLYMLGLTGDRVKVLQRVKELSTIRPKPGNAETATAFAMLGLGDTAQALDALERATDAKEIWPLLAAQRARHYDGVRGSARFRALLTRVGLAPK